MSLLASDRQGDGPAFLWLHGFTQTRAAAAPFRSILAGTSTVVTPDLPGHGESAGIHGSLPETAELLAHQILTPPSAVGGYSFGGRVALHLALAAPQEVSRLVLVSASLGSADPVERAARRDSDNALAAHIRAVGSEQFLAEWLSLPLFATLRPELVSARSTDAEGLASSLEHSGTGTQEYLGDAVSRLTMPVLVLCGERDTKFVAAAHEICERVPNASLAVVPDAGHALHLERPEVAAAMVRDFLA